MNNILDIIKKIGLKAYIVVISLTMVIACEICNTDATCLCFMCKNYFCERCYKLIHDIKNDPKHKKEKIDPYVPIDIKCPQHPDVPMNLFCVDEKGNIIILF